MRQRHWRAGKDQGQHDEHQCVNGWACDRQLHLSSASNQLMISNDTTYTPALVVANPGWHGQYDQDAATAETTRRKLLDRVIADKIMICGYHFPFPGAGTVQKDGAGYA